MKAFELLGKTVLADGTVLDLLQRGKEYVILADGAPLMSSRVHGSEEALTTLACERVLARKRPKVLIGGLGMGFTLRAALDLLSPDATVIVAELAPAVVEWNRGPLAPLARYPLNDRRVQVETGDVAATLRSSRDRFDAVLLDVDNGPAAFTTAKNAALYDDRGIAVAHDALRRQGVLAVWAVKEDRSYVQRLERGGFEVQVKRVRGNLERGGAHHIIFLAQRA